MPILSLIASPFGPYPEATILSDELGKHKPALRNVFMRSQRKPTGLDNTELVAPPPVKTASVHFYGILEIENLSWLSGQGREWLQRELRNRDEEELDGHQSGLTLESLYGKPPAKPSKIRVWIHCKKNMQASFLSKKSYEHDLVFESRFKNARERPTPRFWTIKSMDVETASMSRNYLEHWRFLHFIKELHKTNPSMPTYKYTPKFIMQAMRERFQRGAVHHRHVFNTEVDSDVDEEGNTAIPRRPRHVSTSELYSIMATHAEWFLAQQLVTNHPGHVYVNIKLWHDFCKTAKRIRKKKPRGWGVPYGVPSRKQLYNGNDDYIDLTRFGWVKGGWERRIEKHTNLVYPLQGEDDDEVMGGEEEEFMDDEPVAGRPEYDSDYGHESTETPSDSDSDLDSDADDWPIRLLPSWSRFMPEMYSHQFVWHCPDRNCDYTVDLLNPPRPSGNPPSSLDLSEFQYTEDDYEFLTLIRFEATNPRVQDILKNIIWEHYEEHWRELGIRIVVKKRKNGSLKVSYARVQSDGDVDDEEEQDVKMEDG